VRIYRQNPLQEILPQRKAGKAEVITQDGADCAKNSAESCPVQTIEIT